MPATGPERTLGVAMRAIGVILIVALWPLTRLWPAGWVWHDGGESFYIPMIVGLYATLGVFLVRAGGKPLENLGLVWFTVWSSIVHAVIMAVQAVSGGHATMGHLLGDVPALLVIAAVLAVLTFRAARAKVTKSRSAPPHSE